MGASGRYGYTHVDGKVSRAHRAIFQMSGKSIPPGMELMHSCDVGLCVNPDHLSVGTHQDNMDDMVRKGRARAPTGNNHWTRGDIDRARTIGRRNIVNSHGSGEKNNNAKVNIEIVRSIRAANSANPTQSMVDLGKAFGIGREPARKIVKGIVWKL